MLKTFKKYVSFITALVAVFVMSAGSAGAVNDVVFGSDLVDIQLASGDIIRVLYSGTNVLMDVLVVNTTNIVVTFSDDDVVTLVQPNRKTLNIAGSVTGATSNCNASDFRITVPDQNAAVAGTVTVGSTCSTGGGGGGGGGSPTTPYSPPPTTPTTPTTTPTTTTGEVTATASAGGVTTYTTSESSSAKVTVPASTVTADTTVSVSSEAKSTVTAANPAPTGKIVIGSQVYNMSASSGGSSVKTFTKDLTLEFTYTDAQVAGLNVNSLKVYYYDTVTKAWIAVASTVDVVNKKVTALVNHFTYFAVMGDPVSQAVSLVDLAGNALKDGDLISTTDSFDIYIASFVGTKRFKRLILNPEIFNSYGHLSWSNVKDVSQQVQDQFTLSDLVLEVNADGSVYDPKVYKVSSSPNTDVGQKQWLNMTAAQFEANRYDWDAIAKINHTEAGVNFYPLGTAITSSL